MQENFEFEEEKSPFDNRNIINERPFSNQVKESNANNMVGSRVANSNNKIHFSAANNSVSKSGFNDATFISNSISSTSNRKNINEVNKGSENIIESPINDDCQTPVQDEYILND